MKPTFLTQPDAWMRTPRADPDRVAYACAVQGFKPRRFTWWPVLLLLLLTAGMAV